MHFGGKSIGFFVLIAIIACAIVCVMEDAAYVAEEYGIEEVSTAPDAVELNTADEEELISLPGVGPATAERIISFRSEVRKFETIYDLKLIRGLGEKTFDKIKSNVYVK